MFRWYGFVGIVLIAFSEINFICKIQPFADWYFPIIWFGYIFVIDALVYKIRRRSLLSNNLFQFVGMCVASAFFWLVFEGINYFAGNWKYGSNVPVSSFFSIFALLSFSTVLPALFETVELFRSLHLFEKEKLRKSHNISRGLIIGMIGFGVFCFFAPIFFPMYAFPLIWLSLFFILDPINFLHGQPSIISHVKDRKLVVPLSLLLAGITLGFLWEFWNFWATKKWVYDIPTVGFFKVFEMPILGYLGYFPFALELYAMYWFVSGLFVGRDSLLIT